ncbi:hypothetical protein ACT4R0_02495 [Ornithobacterium rhinotracheale]|uniref:hypothetical protein n=1 Tax=Ornithobacterium rhinotracheale TaxID=28251 RepID=UPI00129C210A|nr:hypothetical protein [Ornithobacterium rhinotracheale]MCK0204816.1 hypothetical protein [Ornithobacterium rhinotracheale]MRI63304.1 hypothetical protein [Ornithobacterium rhinotracheale]MRJ08412.1 hypothetical protein [Ornithobacterium rhinotracheale]MRJ09949.1 hypothetical protein [Ornithobacterium rhinotracheale]UOH77605.1 hypothetical protein MT996_10415 [Ornithobacterium rhinotracheale]
MKNFFLLLFFVYIINTLYVNVLLFSFSMGEKENLRLNFFGSVYLSMYDGYTYHSSLHDGFVKVANLIGVDRGYEFFSPNVSNSKVELLVVVNGENKNILMKSFEGKVKNETFKYLILPKLSKKCFQRKFYNSIANHIHKSSQKIDSASFSMVIKKFSEMKSDYEIQCDTINFFKTYAK